MTELVGDVCIPSELIIPVISGTITAQPALSGAMYISGTLIYYIDGLGQRRRISGAYSV